MAQVYVPENPCERAQLEQPERHGDLPRRTYPAQPERRFGSVGIVVAIPLDRPAHPDRTYRPLRRRAARLCVGYSVPRMFLAYALSLIFTLVYGHIAATSRRTEMVMIHVLDILQSMPILSFSSRRSSWRWWRSSHIRMWASSWRACS